jgi:isopentenyldiphosphate isomerase
VTSELGDEVELVDVVDEDDRVLRVVPRATMRRERLLHRAVAIAVFHPDGRLLVHRRSQAKDVWPGMWDLGVGGVVAAGETWEDAARRELAEEIGVTDVDLEELGRGRFEDESVAMLGRCYRAVSAGPFVFSDAEVVETEWIDPASVADVVAARPFVPDSRAILLPLLGL